MFIITKKNLEKLQDFGKKYGFLNNYFRNLAWPLLLDID
jgi:hypothetical protein